MIKLYPTFNIRSNKFHLRHTVYCVQSIGLLLALFFTDVANAQNYFNIQSGTTVLVNNSSVVFNNTDINNNGNWQNSNTNIVFTGASNNTWNGPNMPQVQTLTINKSVGSKITVQNPFTVNTQLTMQSGLLELNNVTATLQPGATIISETETARVTTLGNNGKIQTTHLNVSGPYQYNPGNLGAMFTTSANLGNVTVSRSSEVNSNPNHPLKTSIQRTYFIDPQNNSNLNAILRLYYFDAELNGKTESSLLMMKSMDGINWINVGFDFRSSTQNFIEKWNLADFSYWTITDLVNVLPVTINSFAATCKNNQVEIIWQTEQEEQIKNYTVQRSEDGQQWKNIITLPALNSTGTNQYKAYDGATSSSTLYRLQIESIHGEHTYSAVFNGSCDDITLALSIVPNPVSDESFMHIALRKNAIAQWQMSDATGKVILQRHTNLLPGLNKIPLPTSSLASGVYFIHFNTETFQQNIKFIKP